MAACGLDFGTSNSALALPSGQVLPIDPPADEKRLFRSVIFFPEGEPVTHTGAEAIAHYLDDGEGRFLQSIKTWLPSAAFTGTQIRGRVFKLEELVAILLRRVRTRAEEACRHSLTEVVLGRPAVFSTDPALDALAQGRLEQAARLAGFTQIRFLIEPIAAALAYEAQITKDELVLVADFGAGTTDLTLMRLGPERRTRADRRPDVVASTGVYVGGDKFDAAIMKHKLLKHFGAGTTYREMGQRLPIPPHVVNKLLSWHEMAFIRERSTQELIQRMLKTSDNLPAIEALHDLVMHNLGYQLFRAIEAAKVKLSSATETRLKFDDARVKLDVKVTRAEFERFSKPLLDELSACTDRLFAAAAAQGVGEAQVDAVFLTGGSSQIPAVRELFRERFGDARLRSGDAFTSVAEGMGRAARE
ncbi:MAG: Hsp70 family protein [Deltaproteobacteria bacterium]|nr:Hsp70 family protein [Deltaproteobacteria bacterium]